MDIGFLNRFEEKIQAELLRICTSHGLLGGVLLATDDVTDHWDVLAPEYVADAVGQIADYPTVSVAWAGYLGLAIAHGWDKNWQACSRAPYTSYYGSQGFDDMDEHIVRDILGIALDTPEATKIEDVMRSCAYSAMNIIRREDTEAQTTKAFYLFARTTRVMFRIGAAIRLKQLGYKFEKQIVS